MKLKKNQAALILEASDDGEITVDVESPDMSGLSSAICHAIAKRLMNDEQFQAELMEMLKDESGGQNESSPSC